jgi:F-type H+-transporting ATPase subunit gamma
MASLLDIKRRIRSVKNTQQITKAMKMVSAAKLRRSQDRILGTRPYALELAKVTAKLAQAARAQAMEADAAEPAADLEDAAALAGMEPLAGEDDDLEPEDALEGEEPESAVHPLLRERPEEKVLLVVVTGDRGLAGSFNANVLRRARHAIAGWPNVELLLLGRKGAEYFGRRTTPVRAAHRELFSNVSYEAAHEIAEAVAAAYAEGRYDAVHVIYNRFKSVMQQELTLERLLPIPVGADAEERADRAQETEATDYLFEPSPQAILADVLPRYVTFQVYRVLLESQAAEHAARMTAMDSATRNAGDMIEKLTLNYNRARQAAITKELIEVVSGANALEG